MLHREKWVLLSFYLRRSRQVVECKDLSFFFFFFFLRLSGDLVCVCAAIYFICLIWDGYTSPLKLCFRGREGQGDEVSSHPHSKLWQSLFLFFFWVQERKRGVGEEKSLTNGVRLQLLQWAKKKKKKEIQKTREHSLFLFFFVHGRQFPIKSDSRLFDIVKNSKFRHIYLQYCTTSLGMRACARHTTGCLVVHCEKARRPTFPIFFSRQIMYWRCLQAENLF